MRILIYTDVHWSESSSLVKGRGIKYTKRLESLINSLNWAENNFNVDFIMCGGDFFNKDTVTSEEIAALDEVKWRKVPHYFLIGNHEATDLNLQFSTAHMFGLADFYPIDRISSVVLDNTEFVFLPYTTDFKLDLPEPVMPRVILSHNLVAGFNYGGYESKIGYSIEDILKTKSLFVNGHLHNAGPICRDAFNLGNLTGQNFTEDAFKYSHNIMIYDTTTRTYEFHENPYAFNFYQLDFTEDNSDEAIEKKLAGITKNNAVVSATCYKEDLHKIKSKIVPDYTGEAKSNIFVGRVMVKARKTETKTEPTKLESINHLDKFRQMIPEVYGQDKYVLEELERVCK